MKTIQIMLVQISCIVLTMLAAPILLHAADYQADLEKAQQELAELGNLNDTIDQVIGVVTIGKLHQSAKNVADTALKLTQAATTAVERNILEGSYEYLSESFSESANVFIRIVDDLEAFTKNNKAKNLSDNLDRNTTNVTRVINVLAGANVKLE